MKKINVLAMVMLVVLFGCATAPEHDLAQQSDVPHTTVSEQEAPSETATPAPQVEEQVTITMWAYYSLELYDNLVKEFNRENNGYQIETTYFIGGDQRVEMALRLENGEMPDILLAPASEIPFYKMYSDGMMEDLLPYIQGDGIELSEDYLRCMTVDGKLYELSPIYEIGCMWFDFDKAELDPQEFDSISSIIALEPALPDGVALLDEQIRPQSYLKMFLGQYFQDFVDVSDWTWDFNTDLLRQVLELTSRTKTLRQQNAMEREPITDCLVHYSGSYNIYSSKEAKGRLPFPTADGNGCNMYSKYSAFMNSKCEHKQGTWDFMRRLLDHDFYDGMSFDYFATNARIDREMWAQTEESDYTRAAKEAISKADRAGRTDTVLLDIILQESLPYFEGQISLDEAVENIQSMASLYIADKWLGQEVTYPPTEVKSVKKLAEAINAAGRTGLPSETRLVDRANELQNIHYFYVPAVEFEGYKLTRISVTPEEIVYHYGDIQVTFYRKEGDFSKKVVYDEEAGTMTAPLEYTWMTISVPPELNDYDYLYSHCQAYITNPSEVILGGPQ